MKKINIKAEYFFCFLWILAIIPKQAVLLISIIYLIFMSKKILAFKKDNIYWIIFLIGIFQIISIFVSMLYLNTSITRYLASLNTSLIWIISAQMYLIFKNSKIKLESVEKYCLINLNIMFALSILAYIFYKLNIPVSNLYGIEWKSYGYTFRLGCFLEFANLIAEFTLLMLPLASIRVLKKQRNFLLCLHYFLAFFVIYYSGSRIALIGFIIYVLLSFYYLLRVYYKISFSLLFTFISIILIFLIINYAKIYNLFLNLFYSREGSNSMRFAIYLESIKTLFEHNPVLGVGTKVLYMGYPLGSHSTYVGMLYKTGFIGLFFFMILILLILIKYHQSNSKLLMFMILSLFVCYIFEDLDATNWSAMTFFSLIGFGLNKKYDEYSIICPCKRKLYGKVRMYDFNKNTI